MPEKIPQPGESVAKVRGANSELRFPVYDLDSSIEVVRKIHERGGGQATGDQLASFLGYAGTNNGSYLARIGAARVFQLIEKSGNAFVLTPLARRILSPVYAEDEKAAKVESFLGVPLYRKLYEDFRGQPLPPEGGLKNALRNLKVVQNRIDLAYRALMESAESAGFFDARGGARTHLIQPSAQASTSSATQPPAGGITPLALQPTAGRDVAPSDSKTVVGNTEARERYLALLIRILEEKSSEGELDEKLMERIERLLGDSAERS
jgi:hypothetical protein